MADLPRSTPRLGADNVVALEASAPPARPRRIAPLAAFGAIATLAWLAFCALYVDRLIGWAALPGMALVQHALMAAGMAAPLLVLWLAIGVIDRGRELRYQVDRLGRQLDALTYRPGDAKARLDTYAEALREQAKILTDASQAAAGQVEDGRRTIADQVRELSNVGDQVALRSNQTLAVLRRHIDAVERLTAGMQTRLHALEKQTGAQSDRLDAASDRAIIQARMISETLDKGVDGLIEAGDRGVLAAQTIRDELTGQGRALAGVAERTIQAASAMQRARAAFEAAAGPLVERGAATGQAMGQIALEFARLTTALDGYGERLGAVLARHVSQLNEVTGQVQSRTNDAGAALVTQVEAVAALQVRAGDLLRQLQAGAEGAGALTATLSDRLEAAATRLTEKADSLAATTDATTERSEALLEVFAEAELGASGRARDLARAGSALEMQLADLARRAADITASAVAAAERASQAEAAMGAGAEATLSTLRAGAQWVADSCSRSAAELRQVIATLRANADAAAGPAHMIAPAAAEEGRQDFLRATRTVLDGLTVLGGDLRKALAEPAGDDRALIAAIRARAAADPGFATAIREFTRRFAATLDRARAADADGVMALTLLASDLGRIYGLLAAARASLPVFPADRPA